MDKTALKRFLIEKAREHGFDEVRVAKAEFMEEEAHRLEDWLNNNHHGEMSYLEDHFDKRVDPTKLVPGAKSVVSLLFNYSPEKEIETVDNYKIARYAYGKDYHYFVKKKLTKLIKALKEKVGDFAGRAFVDSAPILERDWAKRSGLGWIGKNALLLNKEKGSYFLLAELILDIEFEYDHPVTDHCGTCTRCIEACPTDAIATNGYILDASKCISYLTIELKENIPLEFKDKMEDWMFGCDICQEVCPWNRFSTPNKEPRLTPKDELASMRKKDWEEITEEVFDSLFSGTPIKRAQYHGLKRNIAFLSK
jgi:epoxyqueuosine reductase